MKLLTYEQLKTIINNSTIVNAIAKQRPNDILILCKSLRKQGGFKIERKKK